jgi:hypothetical protein
MTTGAMRRATHAKHYRDPPDLIESGGAQSWITRASNFAVIVSQVQPGSVLVRSGQADESMLLLAPEVAARIEANREAVDSAGDSLTILPPGESRVTARTAGVVAHIVTSAAKDIADRASNSATYADGAPEVAPIEPWPQPVGGFRLRHYALEKCQSPDPSPLKMRLFRSTNLMVNVFEPWARSRDERKLSPHSHEDFEQASLGLSGTFIHHIRYPWTSDKTSWREDEHESHESPSVLVIPARAIHTSQNVGGGVARLVDIFAPPRADFSLKPGFVLNADEYPLPASLR